MQTHRPPLQEGVAPLHAALHAPQWSEEEFRSTHALHHEAPGAQEAVTPAEAEREPAEAKNVTLPGPGRVRVTEAVHVDPESTQGRLVPLIKMLVEEKRFTKEAVNKKGRPGATEEGADRSNAGAAEQAPATQLVPEGQALPHAPQCVPFVARSTQAPHHEEPDGHAAVASTMLLVTLPFVTRNR